MYFWHTSKSHQWCPNMQRKGCFRVNIEHVCIMASHPMFQSVKAIARKREKMKQKMSKDGNFVDADYVELKANFEKQQVSAAYYTPQVIIPVCDKSRWYVYCAFLGMPLSQSYAGLSGSSLYNLDDKDDLTCERVACSELYCGKPPCRGTHDWIHGMS